MKPLDFQVQLAGPAEYEELNHIWSWVYTGAAVTEPLDPPEDTEKFYLGRLNGKPVSACQVQSYRVQRGEAEMSCGGVAAVATLTEFRQTGAAGAFMRAILHEMKETGHVISALYAFKESFYRKFGYETCGWRWKITCPQARFPRPQVTLPGRQISPEEIATMDLAYVPFIKSRSGSALRSAADWKNRLGKKVPMIYAVGDPVEGYFWGSMEQFWGDLTLGEVAWSTQRGYENILGVIAGLASNQSRIIWNEPPDSAFLAQYMDQGITCELARPTMFRVLDVPAALSALKPTHAGSFTIRILDELMPENVGPWRIEFSEQGVIVSATDHADLTLDIRQFSQSLMGQPSLEEIARQGKMQVENPAALREACLLLSALPVVCMEFF